MPKSEKIPVMISSRCKATIPFNGKPVLLSELRKVLKKDIEALVLWPGQNTLCDCWINEDSAGSPLNETWWERCLAEARLADVVIVLYNGESCGAIKKEPMGIRHAELEAVLATQSKKVRGIPLPLADLPKEGLQRTCDEAFRAYVSNLDIFGPQANNGKERALILDGPNPYVPGHTESMDLKAISPSNSMANISRRSRRLLMAA